MPEDLLKLFRTAVQYGASDLYLSTLSKPVLRIHGDMIPVDQHPVLTAEKMNEYITGIMDPQQLQTFQSELDLDFALEVESVGRFRTNAFNQRKGPGLVFRLIPEVIKTLDELNLPEQLKYIPEMKNGLVIVTGPTGSGKSTTLAAIVNQINQNYRKHIITVEDPIEFTHENGQSLINQREVGSQVKNFARGLRSALREAPDVILVGEMRDIETISQAITAAETGHLVLATLHTSGAAKSVDRIIDAFPSDQQNQIRSQLSESLAAVVWQNLIKTADGKGRVAALEMMFHNSAIANMIRKGNTHQINSAIETGFNEGMQTMKKAISTLLEQGAITEEEALKYLPEELDVEG